MRANEKALVQKPTLKRRTFIGKRKGKMANNGIGTCKLKGFLAAKAF